jgi:hypothetical protein
MPLVLSNDSGIRPAGDFDKCFYCNQKVGTPHKENCVCLQKKVKLRFSFDLEVEVPYSWDKEDINYYYNEGTWCANNAISLINEYLIKIMKDVYAPLLLLEY